MNTVEWVIWTIRTVGQLFLYVALAIFYGYRVVVVVTTTTIDDMVDAVRRYPLVAFVTVMIGACGCGTAVFLCARGIRDLKPSVVCLFIGITIFLVSSFFATTYWMHHAK